MDLIRQLADPSTLTLSEKLSGGLMVAVVGMTITFLALIFLWLMIEIMAKLLKQKSVAGQVPPVEAPAPVAPQTDADVAIDDCELVAVITAALAASLQTSVDNIVVKNIVRIPDQRPTWAKNGLAEQMNNRF